VGEGEESLSQPRPADLFSFPLRLGLYASDLFVIGACAVVAVKLGSGWSWPLFLCAVAIGTLAALTPELIRKVTVVRLQLTPAQVKAMQPRRVVRRRMAVSSGLTIGVAIGLLAGSFEAVWIDVAYFVAMLLLMALTAMVIIVIVKHRPPTAPNTP
jgi:hypothetical protein